MAKKTPIAFVILRDAISPWQVFRLGAHIYRRLPKANASVASCRRQTPHGSGTAQDSHLTSLIPRRYNMLLTVLFLDTTYCILTLTNMQQVFCKMMISYISKTNLIRHIRGNAAIIMQSTEHNRTPIIEALLRAGFHLTINASTISSAYKTQIA